MALLEERPREKGDHEREADNLDLLPGLMRSVVGDGRSGASGAREEDLHRPDVNPEPVLVPEDGSEPNTHAADGSESVRVPEQEPEEGVESEDDAEWEREQRRPRAAGFAFREQRTLPKIRDRRNRWVVFLQTNTQAN